MKPAIALLMTAALLALSAALDTATDLPMSWAMLAATGAWAAYDSAKIDLRRYQSGISCHPFVLFIGMVMIWIVAFPWYLIVRERIMTGRAQLKTVAQDAPSPPASP